MGTWRGIAMVGLLNLASFAKAAELSAPSSCRIEDKLFKAMSSIPSPLYVALEDQTYRLGSQIFAQILGSSPQSFVINDSQELRFLPATLFRTPILLVLDQAAEFDRLKLQKVLPVAKLQEIRISLLWLGSAAVPRELEQLVEATSGQLWNRDELRMKLASSVYACPKT